MPMGGPGESFHGHVLTEFYALNLVIALMVMVLGGSVIIWLLQRHKLHPLSPKSPKPRNAFIVGLGGLWMLDGLLQLQPFMVTSFVHGVVAPLLPGQPTSIDAMIRLGMKIWHAHAMTGNLLATWVQLTIGALILLGGETVWRKLGLWASIVWGLVVWGPGEGFGNLLSGGSMLAGSPGSVVFYMLAAGALLLPLSAWRSPRWSLVWRITTSGIWALAALLQAWPRAGWWSPHALSTYFQGQARMPQPGLISGPLYALARVTRHADLVSNAALVVIFFIVSLSWALGPPSRRVLWVTGGVTLGTWWLGQDFGVFGGMGTDPNSGAVLLLGVIIYSVLSPHLEPKSPNDRVYRRPSQHSHDPTHPPT